MEVVLTDKERVALPDAFARADVSVQELWLRYFALGGDVGVFETDAFLHGLMPLAPLEHDRLAVALNEYLNDRHQPFQVPYR